MMITAPEFQSPFAMQMDGSWTVLQLQQRLRTVAPCISASGKFEKRFATMWTKNKKLIFVLPCVAFLWTKNEIEGDTIRWILNRFGFMSNVHSMLRMYNIISVPNWGAAADENVDKNKKGKYLAYIICLSNAIRTGTFSFSSKFCRNYKKWMRMHTFHATKAHSQIVLIVLLLIFMCAGFYWNQLNQMIDLNNG